MDLHRNSLGLGEKPALVLVDMINAFTHPESPLGAECQTVIDANIRLLAAFRARGLAIFFTTVVYHNDDQAAVFRERIQALNLLSPLSEWVKVDDQLAKQADEVLIEKQWASAFFKTDLNQKLRSLNVDSIVVSGLTTSGCVRATVVDGLQYEYRVVVAKEAVGDRNPAAHEANLFDMHAKYADVLTVGEIVAAVDALTTYSQ